MRTAKRTSTLREVRSSLGRFFAILFIVALGVGFFSGLKITHTAMRKTGDRYLDSHYFFDYRLLTSYGFSSSDIKQIKKATDARYVEGAIQADTLWEDKNDAQDALRVHSITKDVNQLELVQGHLPQKANECVMDARAQGYAIGDEIQVSSDNTATTKSMYRYQSYKIVGLVHSPLYLNFERGTTSLSGGKISAFLYLLPEGFHQGTWTECYIYTDSKDAKIQSRIKERAQVVCDKVALKSHQTMMGTAQSMLNRADNKDTYVSYVLDRDTNTGYVSFDHDVQIVDGIAEVFPVFFFLVAALVCMTTMNRMVEEQRTEIGVWKALGYSNSSIMGKYLFYSGSAAGIGCLLGYFIGIYAFPMAIWKSYEIMYDFSSQVLYVWNPLHFAISAIVTFFCSVGTTCLSCRHELFAVPAELIRPRSPQSGKRIIWERVTILWNHLSFLRKVSIRNVFRYKKRMFMMILGICGCTALLLTGLGIRDSISPIVSKQYDEVTVFDANISLTNPLNEHKLKEQMTKWETYGDVMSVREDNATLTFQKKEEEVTLIVPSETNDSFASFVRLISEEGHAIDYPGEGGMVLSERMASILGAERGDKVSLTNSDNQQIEVKLVGICKNYIHNYAYISPATWKALVKGEVTYTNVYMNFSKEADTVVKSLLNTSNVSSVSENRTFREHFSKMIKSLDAVVLLVIFCAGALAFIVLYNLTNINITERVREIATLKVLGLLDGEINTYVFRENRMLTVMGALVGILPGIALHRFVIGKITINLVAFEATIRPFSFILALLLTLVFSLIVDIAMRRKLNHIDMAESMKSVT